MSITFSYDIEIKNFFYGFLAYFELYNFVEETKRWFESYRGDMTGISEANLDTLLFSMY